MQVTLYKYTGEQDVANKILQNATVVYNQDVTPYGAFDPNGATFRLSELYDTNYGKFTFNNHDYYGYVNISVDSKGLYNYRITTDALTTAWYADCFNTNNLCTYSNYGDLLIKDPRASEDSENTFIIKNFGFDTQLSTARNLWYIVTILTPNVNNSDKKINNPIFNSYAFTATGYEDFVGKFLALQDTQQNKFSPSIIGVYEIKENIGYFLNRQTTKVIRLYSLTGGTEDKPSKIEYLDITLSGEAYQVDILQSGQVVKDIYGIGNITIPNQPIIANSENLDMQFILHIPDSGNISFTLRSILSYKQNTSLTGFEISSVGYLRTYDFISGISKTYLTINGINEDLREVFPQYCIVATLPLKTPILYDSSIQDWRASNNALVTSGVSFASNIAATVGTTIGAIATGGAGAPLAIGAGVSTVQAGTSFFNAISNFEHQKFTDTNAAASTVGGVGGSVDFAEDIWLVAYYHKSHNLNDIQSKYGRPDGKMRNISQLSGWVQSNPCHLLLNGLPNDIITAAEQSANNGFEII